MNIWNLLPPALVTRAKAVLAVIGSTVYIVISFYPSLAVNHWVVTAIATLTALGVWVVPNSNARSRKADLVRDLRTREPVVLPTGAGHTPPSGLATSDEVRERIWDVNRSSTFTTGAAGLVNVTYTTTKPPEEPGEPSRVG